MTIIKTKKTKLTAGIFILLMAIGKYSGGQFWNGKIDEIGYSNQANGWSAEEVAFLYNSGDGRPYDISLFNLTGTLKYSNNTGVSAGKIIATNEDFTKTNYTTISNGTGHWVIEKVVNSTYTITGYSTNASIDGDVEAHVVV